MDCEEEFEISSAPHPTQKKPIGKFNSEMIQIASCKVIKDERQKTELNVIPDGELSA